MSTGGRPFDEEAPTTVLLSEGQVVFNRYEIVRLVGQGGMGLVYLARDRELGESEVALKFLPDVVVHDAVALDDMKREVLRALQLTHPNIVRIRDFISDGRMAAISMEWVDGGTIREQRLKQGKRVLDAQALELLLPQICEALDYAHQKAKIVHRDIKPANIMLTSTGEVKVADFGIARSLTDTVSQLTQQGTSGTPSYMSPQQLLGKRPAATDDWYALGATLYELLTGKPPFYTGDIVTQIREVEPISIAEKREELGVEGEPVPESWERLVAKLLKKDPAERPGSGEEVLGELRVAGAGFREGDDDEDKEGDLDSEETVVLPVGGEGDSLTEAPRHGEGNEDEDGEGEGDGPASAQGSGAVSASASGELRRDGSLREEDEDEDGEGEDVVAEGDEDKPASSQGSGVVSASGSARLRRDGSLREGENKKRGVLNWILLVLVLSGGGVWWIYYPNMGMKMDKFFNDLGRWVAEFGTLENSFEADSRVPPHDEITGPRPGRDVAVELPGSGGELDLIWIAPGEFMMGSPSSESGRDDDERQHRVILTEGYWLGKTEVTQGQWEAVMGSNPSRFKESGRNAPVERVSWNHAMDFCKKLTERERRAGRLPDGYRYTLPTEAQWEYACRAGTTGPYANSTGSSQAGNLDAMGWYDSNSGSKTHPVGRKQPNAWGLYDMHGNVWEWCRDWYVSDYPSGTVRNPTGPSSGSYRVGRGGSWGSTAQYCRSANRIWDSPGNTNSTLGFRLALTPSP